MNVVVNNSMMANRSDAVLYYAWQFGIAAAVRYLKAHKEPMLPVAPLHEKATATSKRSFHKKVAEQRARIARVACVR